MKPTDQLRQEHDIIKLALSILAAICRRIEKKESVDDSHLDGLLTFIRLFVDQCHHGKEEDFLFPAMEEAGFAKEGGLLCVMLMEHRMSYALINGLAGAIRRFKKNEDGAAEKVVEFARGFINLLSEHIEKENHSLFPMAEQALKGKREGELMEDFNRLETVKIGRGKRREFELFLDNLREIYLNVRYDF